MIPIKNRNPSAASGRLRTTYEDSRPWHIPFAATIDAFPHVAEVARLWTAQGKTKLWRVRLRVRLARGRL
jgi:hypothetical protein